MFKKIVRRNLVALMIPVIIIELMVLYMCMQLSLLDEYKCYKINDISSVDILFKEGEKNITFDLSEKVYPAGFDYVVDKVVKGSYYYSFNGDSIRLFILKKETYDKLSSGKAVSVNARLIQDEAMVSYIKNEYTDSFGLGDNVFDDYIESTIIDEVDYPELKVWAIKVVQVAAFCMLIISGIYTIIALINPALSIGFSNRGMFSSRKELIEVMNTEIEERLDHKEKFLYITEDYVIKAYISHIDITKR